MKKIYTILFIIVFAIGFKAGYEHSDSTDEFNSIAIGRNAGHSFQQHIAIAIGYNSGYNF